MSYLPSPWSYKSYPASKWCSQDWWTTKKTINSERNSRVGSDGNGASISYPKAHQLSQNASTWRVIDNRTDKKATQGELKAILELCLNMND